MNTDMNIDLTGEELILAEKIVGEKIEPIHDHDDDVREEQESLTRWLAGEENKYLSSFSD